MKRFIMTIVCFFKGHDWHYFPTEDHEYECFRCGADTRQ